MRSGMACHVKLMAWCGTCDMYAEIEGDPAVCLACGASASVLTGDPSGELEYQPLDIGIDQTRRASGGDKLEDKS